MPVMDNNAQVVLSPSLLNTFKTGAVFNENTSRVNSLSFSSDGSALCSAANDDSLTVLNTVSGTIQKTLLFKEMGLSQVLFTHHRSAILCAANKNSNGTIMYHSILDNQFLRLFKGHKARVCSLAVSPVNDVFMSGSFDSTIHIWDLRSSTPQAVLTTGPSPCVQFDPRGLLFAATSDASCIRLFDIRSYKLGPFASFSLSGASSWHQIKFSPDGGIIALSSRSGSVVVLDSFSGDHRYTISGFCSASGLEIDIGFSPDGKFLATGSDNGVVHIYDSSNGKEVCNLSGGHTRPVTSLQWNPVMAMIASGAENLALWVPTTT